MSAIRENLESIKFNIKESANNAKRSSEDITLIAVTKTVDVDKILEAIEYGVTDVGENKPQELARKYDIIGDKVKWHLIGSLQTNKVKYIIDKVHMIHSLDRESLCEEIQKRAPKDILNELKETICDDLDNSIKCKDLNIEVKIEWKFDVAFQLS